MNKTNLLLTTGLFTQEFVRCCNEYEFLRVAVAWCGDPKHDLPYKHLKEFQGALSIIVGISFNQTHPDAIEWLLKQKKTKVRVFKDDSRLFHPKVYIFTNSKKYALFIGSSNLTYGGFYKNWEANVLIEGILGEEGGIDISELGQVFDQWLSDEFSFVPTEKWLKDYRNAYGFTIDTQRENDLDIPPIFEERVYAESWLENADWKTYYRNIVEGCNEREDKGEGYDFVLSEARQRLPLPWRVNIFDDIRDRRILGGFPRDTYGALGHVGANGEFRGLMANGAPDQKRIIVNAINAAAAMNPPIDWTALSREFNKLIKLGFKMNVWGRLLCLARPDMYCTISSESLRTNLSKTLNIPKDHLNTLNGYIQLLQLIHSSPWFNSSKPKNQAEAAIWERRVAFLDAIFH